MNDLEKLIKAAQGGDKQAFAKVISRFKDMAFGYAHALLGDFHLAEDITQEAFIQAYHNLDKLRNTAAFAGWFREIVRFQCNRLLRARHGHMVSIQHTDIFVIETETPEHTIQDREMTEVVLRAIRQLSEPLREVTTLFYINGYSHQEISTFLEVPVNTIKSRLNASRKHLNQKVVNMAKQAFEEHRLGDDFTGKVIEGVPRVGFFQGGQNCPESYPFPSCLAACLRHMGQDYGTKEIDGPKGNKWTLNNTYVYLMGVSGEAFRLFWRSNWDLGNSNILSITPDSRQFFEGAFKGIGYAYEILNKQDQGINESVFRRRIVESIRDHARPVLGFGVVGPPECCIVTGFDQGGEVLMGWSFFQDKPEWNIGIDIEPCGYFRKHHWYKDTWALVLIGAQGKPSVKRDIYHAALRRAVKLVRKPTIVLDSEWHSGLAAFTQWAAALIRHEDLPQEDMALLRQRHMVHSATVGMVAEGRWYGSLFLKHVSEELPDLSQTLQGAIECLEKEHQLMWQIWGLVGGHGFDDDKVAAFAKPEIREQMVPLIHQARDLDAQAAEHLALIIDD